MKNHNMKKVMISILIIIGVFVIMKRFRNDYGIKDASGKVMGKIACVGDSITYGAGVKAYRKTQSYPAILQKLLGNAYQVENFGLSGRTLLASGNHPYTKESAYRRSLEMNADLYIIMLGTNDAKPCNWNEENYEAELGAFVQTYQSLDSQPEVILMQPPKVFEVDGKVRYDIDGATIGNEIHQIVERVGREMNCKVIDLYSLTENHPEWFVDGVHPNAEGNRQIAEPLAAIMLEHN